MLPMAWLSPFLAASPEIYGRHHEHKPRQLNAAAQLIGAHAALDLAINGMWEFPLRANGLTGQLFGHHSLGLVGRSGHVEYS